MFSLTSLRDIYRHMEWADSMVWSALISSDTARDEPALLDKLRHIHRTQQYFLAVWRGETLDFTREETSRDEELERARAFHSDARMWLEALNEDELGREACVPWADRYAQRIGRERAEPTSLGETVYQAAAHSSYHRGQASTLLRQAGVTPPLVDYIAWLWLGRPEPQWP